MNFGIIKDVMLVLLGGFFTFLFTLVLNRIQRKEPNIEWRRLPQLSIPSHNLVGISYLIENNGRTKAKDITIKITIPKGATFQSLEVEPSEQAMKYTIHDSPSGNSKTVIIPNFTNKLSLSLSCLIANLSDKDIDISIVGEDIVGKEKKDLNKKRIEKFSKYIAVAYLVIYLTVIVGGIVAVSSIGVIGFELHQMEQNDHIAAFHVEKGDYDGALKIYKSYLENSLLNKNSPIVNFKMAVIYAKMQDVKNCIECLKVSSNKMNIKRLINQEPSFKVLNKENEFKEFLKSI